MRRSLTVPMTLAGLFVSVTSFGHDGHGPISDNGTTLAHYLTEPYHLLQIAALVVVASAMLLGLRSIATRRVSKRQSQPDA